MKKFNAIIREVKQTQKKIKELEEQTKQLRSTYLNIMDLKERREKRKSVESDIAKLEEKKADLQIAVKVLNSNANIALFNEVMPQVLEVLAKYKGKPLGPRTEQKIKDEIKHKANCYFYIISDRFSQSYCIQPINYNCNVYNVKCGTKCEKGEQKKLLIDNKVQAVEFKDLAIHSSKEYIDDIPARVNKLKELYKKAVEKQQELDAICSEYNSLTVGDIKHIYSDKHI